MLSNKDIIEITKKNLGEEPIGYQRLVGIGVIIPTLKLPDNPNDVPAMGGCWYIDEETKKMSVMEFLDLIEYDGQTDVVKF